MENQTQEWFDAMRRFCSTRDQAIQEVDSALPLMEKTMLGALARKLESGFELVSGPDMEYIHVVDFVKKSPKMAGCPPQYMACIEVKWKSVLRPIA